MMNETSIRFTQQEIDAFAIFYALVDKFYPDICEDFDSSEAYIAAINAMHKIIAHSARGE